MDLMAISFNKLGNYGRLGNQMFQYAMLRSVGLKNNYDIVIPRGNYDLLNFNIHKKFVNNINQKNYYEEKYFHYNESIFNSDDSTDFVGYFQSEKYFLPIKNIILDEFIFKKDIIDKCDKIINNIKEKYKIQNIVSIHVRRGDYLLSPQSHPLCNLKYYIENMKFFMRCSKSYFIIFSDDINWCKRNFIFSNIIYSEGNNNFEDMCLMSKCDHNIIANSSYSWWGAYLNKNTNKIIKYPEKWFGPLGPQDTQDLIPNDWKRNYL
ncbi:MAG: alpha-1,2-fucosyltransferase [Bacteroidia bacterium]